MGVAISELLRKSIKVEKEIILTDVFRLQGRKWDIGGHPPVVVTFENSSERDAILSKNESTNRMFGLVVGS